MKLSRFFEPISASSGNIQAWRERILSLFLVILLIFGTFAYITNVAPTVRRGLFGLAAFYTLAYLWVVGITLINRTPYWLRAGSVLSLAYLLGPLTLIQYGLSGDGRIWLLFFVVFTSILLGLRAGLAATVLGTITYIALAFLMTRGIVPPPSVEFQANSGSAEAWSTTGAVLLWLTLSIVFSLGVLLQGLENSLKNIEKALETEKNLSEELQGERRVLEHRSMSLERRLAQIRTAADITRVLAAVLDPKELMQRVVDLVKERFDLYYVGVFLVDERSRYAELVAGTDESGQVMIAEGHKLSVGGSSMVGWATAHGEARIALDVGQEAIRFNNPHLPLTRSELALPLTRAQQVIGAMTVQSVEPEAFDEDDIAVLQLIADSLATALENARLFQQIEDSLQEIRTLNRQYLGDAWAGLADREQELRFTIESGSKNDEGNISAFDMPLTLRDEQVIGNIQLETDRSQLSDDELEFLQAVSNQAALALESARLLEETQSSAERERRLSEMTTKFARSLDLDVLLQDVVRELGKLPKVREVSIHVTPPKQTAAESNGQQDETDDDQPEG